MSAAHKSLDQLRDELSLAREKVVELEGELDRREKATKAAARAGQITPARYPFTKQQYIRYGRQMILPAVGLDGTHSLDPRLS